MLQRLLEQTAGQQPEAVRALIAQVSQPAVSPASQQAEDTASESAQRVWEPAIQQTRKSALPTASLSAAASQQRAPGPTSPAHLAPKDAGGICADVRLRLDQDLVLTRSAFNATLELINNDPVNPLNNVQVQVNVLDANGAVVNDRFTILTNGLSNLSATDGTGIVTPSTTGTAAWLILPAPEAAPDQPTAYSVGGYLSYQQGGTMLVVPFQPVPITVYPDPQLHVKYFHQRDVFSDDPFTSLIEPSIPFSLAVMIQNTGHGAAKDVKITSRNRRSSITRRACSSTSRSSARKSPGRTSRPRSR